MFHRIETLFVRHWEKKVCGGSVGHVCLSFIILLATQLLLDEESMKMRRKKKQNKNLAGQKQKWKDSNSIIIIYSLSHLHLILVSAQSISRFTFREKLRTSPRNMKRKGVKRRWWLRVKGLQDSPLKALRWWDLKCKSIPTICRSRGRRGNGFNRDQNSEKIKRAQLVGRTEKKSNYCAPY